MIVCNIKRMHQFSLVCNGMPFSEVDYAPSYWGRFVHEAWYTCIWKCLQSKSFTQDRHGNFFPFSKSLWHYPGWAEIFSLVLLGTSRMSAKHKTHSTNAAWFICSLNTFSAYEKKKYQRTSSKLFLHQPFSPMI